jgi:3-hydroxy-9,10-secoandrosta-1,3,5(10)-triene-9,17-dione monooxygenase
MGDVGSQLVDRARKLVPLLAEHAAEAEQLRRPHDTVIAALEESKIFELMVPRCHGGLELDLDTFLEVGLTLAEGDASMAWVTTFYIEHNWMLCQFPASFQQALYASRSHVLAPAMVSPNGRAEVVEGGLRLSGRWSWATGSAHGDWVIVGASVSGSPEPDIRFIALPRSDVIIEDTWHVDGMCATASNDVIIEDKVVPEERSVSMIEMSSGTAPGSKLHEGPLYRTPMPPILGLAASMPAVGQARAALRGFREHMGERMRLGQAKKQSEKPAAQMRLARAEVEIRQAESLLRDTVREMMKLRDGASPADRSRWMASMAFAVHQSRRVIGAIAESSGASAHFLSHSLQRAKRDVDTLSCHVIFDLDAQLESHGRALLGLQPNAIA